MKIEVKVPTVGESITEGILAGWKVKDGAYVKADDPLFELETDKVSMTVVAEAAGKITLSAKAGATVLIGSSVATIETDTAPSVSVAPASPPVASAVQPPSAAVNSAFRIPNSALESPRISAPAGVEAFKEKMASPPDLNSLAPSVRRIVAEENLDPRLIPGTGKGGRITKEDAEKAKEEKGKRKEETSGPAAAIPLPPPPVAPVSQILNLKSEILNRTTRHPMSSLRHRIAERMVEAQHNAAILTTFNEVDMSVVMSLRAKFQEAFVKRYGVKLGFMSFFVKATIEALKAVPEVNAQLDGTEIVENHYYDIGVAVSTERGLVVPVIRDADRLTFGELEQQIASYAEKARNKTLTLEELQGGVFTISNGGVFGSMLSTPILNPPQSAILGLHGIKKRPVVVGDDDRIEVRPMMYLAVSYDHRLIDGRESVAFLRRIVECIEAPERMMVGV